jgi:hypothetical protein
VPVFVTWTRVKFEVAIKRVCLRERLLVLDFLVATRPPTLSDLWCIAIPPHIAPELAKI